MEDVTMAQESVRAAEIDERAVFAQRVMACKNTLYAISRAMLHNQQDAMDAVQDTVTQAWAKRGALRDEGAFAPWLNRILVNTCKNQYRRRKPTAEFYDMPAPQTLSDEIIDIRCAMAALDEKTRVCAVLFYYEDMTIRDISQALGLSQGTVKSRLNRARKKLRVLLEVR